MKNILASILLAAVLVFHPFGFAAEPGVVPPVEAAEPDIKEFEPSSAPQPNTLPYYEKTYEDKPDQFKPLSMGTGVALGLSPINGDGLIYTGHRVSGIFLILTEALIAAPLIIVGAAVMAEDDGFSNDLGKGFFTAGMTMFGITYAIDAIATPIFVSQHNKHLKSTQAPKVSPYFTLQKEEGFRGGITVQF